MSEAVYAQYRKNDIVYAFKSKDDSKLTLKIFQPNEQKRIKIEFKAEQIGFDFRQQMTDPSKLANLLTALCQKDPSIAPIPSLYADISKKIDLIKKSIEKNKLETAETAAQELYKQIQELVRLNGRDLSCFSHLTKVIDLVTSEELQLFHSHKYLLSKTSTLLADLVMEQKDEVIIYPSTRTRLLAQLSTTLDTIPRSEVATTFHLKCTQAVIHSLQPGTGKWMELAKQHTLSAIKGSANLLLLGSPTAILGTSIEVGYDIFKEFPSSWYPELSKQRLFFYRSELNDTLLQVCQSGWFADEYQKRNEYAFCLLEMFIECMQCSQITDEAKKAQLQEGGETVSLATLASLDITMSCLDTIGFDSCSNIRYRAAQLLIEFSKKAEWKESCVRILAERLLLEEVDKLPHIIVKSFFDKDVKSHPKLWKKSLQRVDVNSIKTRNESFLTSIKEKVITLEKAQKDRNIQLNGMSTESGISTLADPKEKQLKQEIDTKQQEIDKLNTFVQKFESSVNNVEAKWKKLLDEIKD